MNAMRDAIKKRRIGQPPEEQPSGEGEKDLHGLVAQLSHEEKEALKSILDGDSKVEQEIPQGGPSSEERAEIETSIAEEDAANAAEEDQVDSDEIGKSMLDSRYLGEGPQPKPRHLGERVKQSIANNLKSKGKL